MKIIKHSDTLFQLRDMWVINCYLVKEADGWTLIDCLTAGKENAILSAARDIGATISRIAITHAHVDHIGAIDGLVNALPAVEVMGASQSAEFMRGNLTLRADQPQTALKPSSYPKVKTQPTRLVKDGDRIGSLRVVECHGHTPAHLAFYDERDGSLIAGDAFQTQGGIAVAGTWRWGFPLPVFGTWYRPLAVQSAHKLLALDPSRLAVGHGKVLENPQTAMRAAIDEAERKMK